MRNANVLFVITAALVFTGWAHAATWTGNGGDNNWTTGANWGGTAPSPGDILIFPSGTPRLSPNNDFAANTNFASISINDTTGYTISGMGVLLPGGGTVLSSSGGANSVQIPLKFSSPGPMIVCSAGSLTLSGNIDNNTFDISFDSTAPITVSGIISNSGGINESGSGGVPALTLSGANTYGGTTTINNMGTLIAANNSALGGTGNGTVVNSGGVLMLDGGVTVTGEALSLDGSGQGSGALVNLTGANVFSGNITIASNLTLIGATSTPLTLGSSGTLSLGSNTVSFFGGGVGAAINVSQTVTGTGGVQVSGGVIVTLSGTNSYSGVTNIVSGTLIAPTSVSSATDGPLGNSIGAVQLSGSGGLQVGGPLFARDISIGGGFPVVIMENGANVSGMITLTAPSSALEISSDMTATTATVSGAIDTGAAFNNVGFAAGPAQALTASGVISDFGGVSIDGPGAVTLGAANTYSGGTVVNAGTLAVGAPNALPMNSDVSLGGNTLDLTLFGAQLNSVTGAGMILLGNNSLVITNSGTTTIDSSISDSGAGNLTMSGSGKLTLTSTSTYSGSTHVFAGTLAVNGTQSASNVSVSAGATLQGIGTFGGLNSTSGTINVGDPVSLVTTFTSGGAVVLDSGSTLNMKVKGFTVGTNQDQLSVSGGSFTAAGLLNLDLTGLAAPGTAASIVTYTSHSGAFNAVNLTNDANNYGATLNFNATALDIVFSAVLPAPTLAPGSDSGIPGDDLTNVNKPTINGIGANAGATITIFDAANMLGTATADGAGDWTFTCPSPLSDGPHALVATQSQFGGLSAPLTILIDTAGPTLTIAMQAGQADPTAISPVKFLVTASEPLMPFTGAAVQISGTAGATTATVTPLAAPLEYEVDVSGMTQNGTVIINLPAGAVADLAGNLSLAATITDNTVTFNAIVPPAIDSPLAVCTEQGQPFTYTITATGTAPIAFTATGLPAGLSLNGAVISGIPTVFGAFPVTLHASNAATTSDTEMLTITIAPAPPTLTSALSAQGIVKLPFNYILTGSGAQPLAFSLDSTQLPPGLLFSGSTIAGVPTMAGNFNVTVTLTDITGQVATEQLQITILDSANKASPVVDPIESDTDEEDAGVPIAFDASATDPAGTALTYAWTITSGPLPATLAVANQSEYLQAFDAPGMYTVRVTVTNAAGLSAFQEETVQIDIPNPAAPVLGSIVPDDPFPYVGQVITLTATGATAANAPLSFTWDFGDGSGVTAASTANSITHAYSRAGDFTVTLRAADALAVNARPITTLISVFSATEVQVPPLDIPVQTVIPTMSLVQLPLSTMVTASQNGRIQLNIVEKLPNTSIFRELSAGVRAANEFTTDFGIGGRSSAGVNPSVHFQQIGLFVATTSMRDKATKALTGKSRITLPVSRADIGLPPLVSAQPKSRVIGITGLSGAFHFSANGANSTLSLSTLFDSSLSGRSGAASDKISIAGSFELPAGVDMSKPQEMQIAFGNVVEGVVVSPKGIGSGLRSTLKVTTHSKSKSPMTQAGQMARFSLVLNAPGLASAGFDTEGVTSNPRGSGVVVQGALMVAGVTYGVNVPTTFGVNSKKTTGQLKFKKK